MNASTQPAPRHVSRAQDAPTRALISVQFTRWVFWLCLIFGGVMLAAGMRLLTLSPTRRLIAQ